jgi:hypothetical protein
MHHRVPQRVRATGAFDRDDGRLQVATGERAVPAVGAPPYDAHVTAREDTRGEGIAVIVWHELVVGPRLHVQPDLKAAVGRLAQ